MQTYNFASALYKRNGTRLLLFSCVVGTLVVPSRAAIRSAGAVVATLRSADIHIKVQAGVHSPALMRLYGKSGNVWRNAVAEAPPQHVYSGGNLIPVTRLFRPDLSIANSRHVEFVYETATPHLQFSWQWMVRARFGAIEHRIAVTNLSQQEISLPLVDSLRLDWQLRPHEQIENVYIEKGEALASRMIANSRELGLEMFQLDAGWFRGVGDWYPDPKKFPHGLAILAEQAHKNGLRFGLWVDWTQAGLDSSPGALNARDPTVRDWLVNDLPPDWRPEEFKGQTIDLGVSAAREYASKEVKRIVEDDHLDMLEHDGYLVAESCTRDDHPHAPPDGKLPITHDAGFDFALGSNSTDVSYHAVRAYYSIYEKVRREHPGLLFEICNDGGRMVDFGSAAHGDYFSITDSSDPLSNRRAFFDASHLLPPAMLESYIAQTPTPHLENFLYMLRSGMMGWMTIMLDTTMWSAQQQEAARQAFALYKSALRPLIRDARLYHVSDRPDGVHWDGMEYRDPKKEKGVLFAFRGTVTDETQRSFRLSGLRDNNHYHIHFEDGTTPDEVITGRQLRVLGLTVHLQKQLSSELAFVENLTPEI